MLEWSKSGVLGLWLKDAGSRGEGLLGPEASMSPVLSAVAVGNDVIRSMLGLLDLGVLQQLSLDQCRGMVYKQWISIVLIYRYIYIYFDIDKYLS